jgi:cardiolipin synthase
MMRIRGEDLEQLRQMGVEVKIFNPVHHYVNRLYFNYRDHRKITSIDGDTVYTGGVNVGDEYANITHKLS